jgi:hypothetical protein
MDAHFIYDLVIHGSNNRMHFLLFFFQLHFVVFTEVIFSRPCHEVRILLREERDLKITDQHTNTQTPQSTRLYYENTMFWR